MNVRTGSRVHQTRERLARLASVIQHLATPYASLVVALSGSNSAVYGHENQSQNQRESSEKNTLNKISKEKSRKAMKQNEFNLG